MGAGSTISYRAGATAIHRLDPRTKQALVLVGSIVSLAAGFTALSVLSVLILLAGCAANLKLGRTIREIRYFLLFLLFVFAVRACSLDPFPQLSLPSDQVIAALLFCWRLLLVVLLGLLLISTTRVSEIRAALIWGLRPLPLVNEQAAGTMIGLLVRFLPLILHEAGEIGEAMRARCVEVRKNPAVRLVKFTTTLFRRTFGRADLLVESMQARCYSEARTPPELVFGTNDLVAAAIGLLLVLGAFFP